MAEAARPVVGEWYAGTHGAFRVVAMDEASSTVEIQYYDSTLEDLDLDAWEDLQPVFVAPPEDWSGPFDDIEPHEMDEADEAMRPHDWGSPLDGI